MIMHERVAGIMKVGQIDSYTFAIARFCVYLLLNRGILRRIATFRFRLVKISLPLLLPFVRMYFESDILGIFAHQGGRGGLRNKLGDTVSPPWRVILWRVTALIESSARRRAVFLALTAKRLNDPTCNHDSLSYCLPSPFLPAFPPLDLFSLEIVRSQR